MFYNRRPFTFYVPISRKPFLTDALLKTGDFICANSKTLLIGRDGIFKTLFANRVAQSR